MNRAASLAAVALGAVVTALSFPSTDAGFLAWFGLVPLLLAVRGRSVREAFGLGWLFDANALGKRDDISVAVFQAAIDF